MNGDQQTTCKIEKKLLCQLEADIEAFDKIFLIVGRQKLVDGFLELLCDSQAVKTGEKKILVLASSKRWTKEAAFTYRQIIEYESEQLCRLYSIYEFSDRFQIISESTLLYGSLFQLVNTGLLSPGESVSALLH